jgi:serralysin
MENLKAETEYVHANLPGVKTFVKLGNIGTTGPPDYMNFGLPGMLDVYGIGGYPCRTANLGNPAYPDGCDIDMFNRYVQAARDAHIPPEKMAPTYQAFAGWSNVFIIPSAEQQQAILRRWKELLPAPPMFMAYSYSQQANSTGAIATVPHLQEVFRDWNTPGHRRRD